MFRPVRIVNIGEVTLIKGSRHPEGREPRAHIASKGLPHILQTSYVAVDFRFDLAYEIIRAKEIEVVAEVGKATTANIGRRTKPMNTGTLWICDIDA